MLDKVGTEETYNDWSVIQQIESDHSKHPTTYGFKHTVHAVKHHPSAKNINDAAYRQQLEKKINKHLKITFAGFEETASRLKLDRNLQFKSFLLDLYISSPVSIGKKQSVFAQDEQRDTVLLDRFVRLLISLDRKDLSHCDKQSLVNSLFPLTPSAR